jgi:hypothetical protein
MRAVAWVGGLVVVAGLVFLAVAGFPGAVPILVSAAALVAMIGLGGVVGGRHTPNVAPMGARHPGPSGGPGATPGTGPDSDSTPDFAPDSERGPAGAEAVGDGTDATPSAP